MNTQIESDFISAWRGISYCSASQWTSWMCKITVSVKHYDLEAVVHPAGVWLVVRLTAVPAPPQLVSPVALGAGRWRKRRCAGSWSCRSCRVGDDDLVCGCCRWRPLDGGLVVSPQEAHAGRLLLLCLLLTLQLLMEDHLNVLLWQQKQAVRMQR